ncbi:MAG: hypothetical protein CL814_10190 [Confluentimicrobium sp.]|uniref:DUF3307 domain-containing protein n=1 Tax=Actibacterium sp. TaxID=1872125 RepID=UPI000C486F7E|nr:DUF3307 domain-containing protein [Actibacterium sp.]MBC57292.1 hypothetical protein [Actibacterium sp.]|tara:strand:+ start:942 stop:1670 length:729 start_codon:yes stop_codon:yes gene_type:complete
MIETLVALLFAHVLADFVFQTRWSTENKRRPQVLLLHVLIVLVTAQAATGRWDAPELIALALAHGVIDAIKTHLPKGLGDTLAAYLTDQAAHLATIIAVAAISPALYASGLWAGLPALPQIMLLVAGLLLVTRAGGFAVGMLMRPYQDAALPEGLRNGGRLIGVLERAMIFLMVMVGEPAGIGFLIAAKSILRFDTASQDQRASEYVIIGTLASFAWALLITYATLSLLRAMSALEIALRGA